MLLPGAHFIIGAFIFGVCLSICILIGRIFGMAVEITLQNLFRHTKIGKKLSAGYHVKEPWWMKNNIWYYSSWVTFTLIFTYCMAGPGWTFYNWIK